MKPPPRTTLRTRQPRTLPLTPRKRLTKAPKRSKTLLGNLTAPTHLRRWEHQEPAREMTSHGGLLRVIGPASGLAACSGDANAKMGDTGLNKCASAIFRSRIEHV